MLACGIDFGTSNSLAAVAGPEGVRLCAVDPVNADPQLLPSLLYFSRYHAHCVGRAATHAYQEDPDGRFVRALKSALPDTAPDELFRMFRDSYALADLLCLVLSRIRERVEESCGAPVTRVTLGRPVRFSPDPAVDRRAQEILRTAAGAAGFAQVRFLSEPEAATRYYFAGEPDGIPRLVLVFDFGGGTLDLCLARMERGSYTVLGTAGAHIGGTLLDRILFEQKLLVHLGKGRKWGRGLDLPNHIFNRLVNPDASWRVSETEYAREVRRILDASAASGRASPQLRTFHTIVTRRMGPDLFAAIEAAKVRLSDVERTEIRFAAGDVEITAGLARAELRELFREQLDAIRTLILGLLERAGRRPGDVDRVLLAGGSSALICTQELLHELFGPERVPLRQDLFTSIVSGLALDAASDSQEMQDGRCKMEDARWKMRRGP